MNKSLKLRALGILLGVSLISLDALANYYSNNLTGCSAFSSHLSPCDGSAPCNSFNLPNKCGYTESAGTILHYTTGSTYSTLYSTQLLCSTTITTYYCDGNTWTAGGGSYQQTTFGSSPQCT